MFTLQREHDLLVRLSQLLKTLPQDRTFQWLASFPLEHRLIEQSWISQNITYRLDCVLLDPQQQVLWIVDFKTYRFMEHLQMFHKAISFKVNNP